MAIPYNIFGNQHRLFAQTNIVFLTTAAQANIVFLATVAQANIVFLATVEQANIVFLAISGKFSMTIRLF